MLVVLAIYGVVIFLYVTSYVINKKTERPENDYDFSGCSGCGNMACGHNTNHSVEEVK